GQARDRGREARHGAYPLHPGRADDGAALRRRAAAARSAASPGGQGQYRGGDRAQPRRGEDRRLGRRSRAGGRCGGRGGGRPRVAGAGRPGAGVVHGAVPAEGAGGGALWVIRPLVSALAKRLAGEARRATPDELAALRAEFLDEMQQVRQELGELVERVDFTERLVAKQREVERLAPPGSR